MIHSSGPDLSTKSHTSNHSDIHQLILSGVGGRFNLSACRLRWQIRNGAPIDAQVSAVLHYIPGKPFHIYNYHFQDGTDMHVAVALQDIAAIRILKDGGWNLEARDSAGRTPLRFLFDWSPSHPSPCPIKPRFLNALKKLGFDVNATDDSGVNAFLACFCRAQWANLDTLVSLGAKPPELNSLAQSHIVRTLGPALRERIEGLEYLGLANLERLLVRIEANKSWLGNETLKGILNWPAESGAPTQHLTLMQSAARTKYLPPELMRRIVRLGGQVEPEFPNMDGIKEGKDILSPFQTAAFYGRPGNVQTLLELGADPSRRSARGQSIIQLMASRPAFTPDFCIRELLAESGVDITPLLAQPVLQSAQDILSTLKVDKVSYSDSRPEYSKRPYSALRTQLELSHQQPANEVLKQLLGEYSATELIKDFRRLGDNCDAALSGRISVSVFLGLNGKPLSVQQIDFAASGHKLANRLQAAVAIAAVVNKVHGEALNYLQLSQDPRRWDAASAVSKGLLTAEEVKLLWMLKRGYLWTDLGDLSIQSTGRLVAFEHCRRGLGYDNVWGVASPS